MMATTPNLGLGALVGLWAVQPEWLSAFVERVRTIDATEAAAFRDQAPARTRYVVQDGVGVVDIKGPLTKEDHWLLAFLFGATSTSGIGQAVDAAATDPAVKSIVLRVDSPGGQVAGTADLGDLVARVAKPTFAFIEDFGASGAYWIASQVGRGRLFTNTTGQVGSIGVFTTLEDSSKLAERIGVKVHVISSGPHKGAGVPGAPVTEEQVDELQARIDALGDRFVAAVSKGRGLSVSRVRELATGAVLVGSQAVDAELVDGIATFQQVLQMARGGAASAHKSVSAPAVSVQAPAAPAALVPSKKAKVNMKSKPTSAPTELRAQLLERIEARAVTGYPRRTKAEAITLFRQTPQGVEMFQQLDRAPRKLAEALTPKSNSLPDLRACALEEARLEGAGANEVFAEIEAAAYERFPSETRPAAVTAYLVANPSEYARHRRASSGAVTVARERYVVALVDDEVSPLVAGFRSDGLERHDAVVAALKLAPGLYGTRRALERQARGGAPVAALEAGSEQRRELVKTLVGHVEGRQRELATAEFEPEDQSFADALAEVLGRDESQDTRAQLRRSAG